MQILGLIGMSRNDGADATTPACRLLHLTRDAPRAAGNGVRI